MKRRPAENDFGFKADSRYSGAEGVIRQSKKLEAFENEDTVLNFTRANIQLEEIGETGTGLVAIGGFIRSSVIDEIDIYLSCETNEDTYRTRRRQNPTNSVWAGFGTHLIVPHSTEANLYAELRISVTHDGSVHLYGLDLNVVDHWLYLENHTYNDGRTALDRFQENEPLHIPNKYYFPFNAPFSLPPDNIGEINLETGQAVLLKPCNRGPEHLLPVEVGKEKENSIATFAKHVSGATQLKILEAESTVDPYILTGEIGERVIRPRKFYRSPSRAGQVSHIFEGDFDLAAIELDTGYQYECNACKKFEVNNEGNSLRTGNQLFEDRRRRRALGNLLDELLNIQLPQDFHARVRDKFENQCFFPNCNETEKLHVDHVMPLSYLWHIEGNAAILCETHNLQKGDQFPVKFYDDDSLKELEELTDLGDVLWQRVANPKAVTELTSNIVWFFDEFIQELDDSVGPKVVVSIQKHLDYVGEEVDLIERYISETGYKPSSVTIKK